MAAGAAVRCRAVRAAPGLVFATFLLLFLLVSAASVCVSTLRVGVSVRVSVTVSVRVSVSVRASVSVRVSVRVTV